MKKVTEFIMKILKPLIDEYKIRKREDAELNDAVLKEIERIKEKRKNKNKNIFRNNAFFDSIASKMEDANDERTIRNFETRQKKELETVRKYREKNYIWSILSLIGILLLILAIIITIAAVCENSKIEKDNNPSTIEINSLEKEGETKEKLNSQPDIKTDTLSENVDKAGNLLENDIEVLEQNDVIEEQRIENEAEPVLIENKERENTEIEQEKTSIELFENEYTVWIPTNGGSKYHSKASCSKMRNPMEISISQAKKRGYTACQRCN